MRPAIRTRGFISRPRSPARSARGYAAPTSSSTDDAAAAASDARSPSSSDDALRSRRRSRRRRRPGRGARSRRRAPPRGRRRPPSRSPASRRRAPRAECAGRFSHADVSNAASAPRKSLEDVVARAGAEEADAAVEPELVERVARALRAPARRPARASETPGDAGRAPRARRRAPSARSACPPCASVGPRSRARARASVRDGSRRERRAPGSGRPSTRPGSRPQPSAIVAQVRARDDDPAGTAQRARSRRAQRSRTRRPPRSSWKSSSVPSNRPARRSRS